MKDITESEVLSLSLMRLTLHKDYAGARALLSGLTREQIEAMLISQAMWSATNLLDQLDGNFEAASATAIRWTAGAATALAEQQAEGSPS